MLISRPSRPGRDVWRRIHPLSLLSVSAGILALAFVFLLIFTVCGHVGAIVFASALTAAAGVIFTGAATLHSQARDRAFKLLESSVEDAELFAAMKAVRDFFWRCRRDNLPIAVFARFIYDKDIEAVPEHCRAAVIEIEGNERSADILEAVFIVGNFFEQLAIAVKFKEVNEGILYEFYCGMLYRSYLYMREFMPILRNDDQLVSHSHGAAQLPELFTTVQWIFDRWAPCYEAEYNVDPARFDAADIG